MKITKRKVNKWNLSLLKRASKLGKKVFSSVELNILRKEIKDRKVSKCKR